MHRPDFAQFEKLATGSNLVPVYRRLLADTLTPVSAYCSILRGSCSFLFESVVGGEKIGRYSFLGGMPFLRIEASGTQVTVTPSEGETRTFQSDDPLQELEKLIEQFKAARLPELPGFCGGAVGYAGYDVVRYTEHLPDTPTDDRKLPDMSFAFYDHMVIFDHINKSILVVAHARTDTGDTNAEYESACQRVDDVCRQLQQATTDLQLTDIDVSGTTEPNFESNFTQEEFEKAVEACREYIRAGDIFQVGDQPATEAGHEGAAA